MSAHALGALLRLCTDDSVLRFSVALVWVLQIALVLLLYAIDVVQSFYANEAATAKGQTSKLLVSSSPSTRLGNAMYLILELNFTFVVRCARGGNAASLGDTMLYLLSLKTLLQPIYAAGVDDFPQYELYLEPA